MKYVLKIVKGGVGSRMVVTSNNKTFYTHFGDYKMIDVYYKT